jgi:hypothetical protein
MSSVQHKCKVAVLANNPQFSETGLRQEMDNTRCPMEKKIVV